MNYYRRFPGDYTRDTRHLTLEQHGAYTLLLDHAYSTESPIVSLEAAMKICAAMSKRERLAVKFVLDNFWGFSDVGYTNSRVKKEITYTESISNVRRRAANSKHQKHANAEQMQSNSSAIPDFRLHTPEPKEHRVKVKDSSPTVKMLGSQAFLEFWELYPNKVDRMEALKIWMKGFFDGLSGEILAGLEQWKRSEQWTDSDKIPYPSTWLNKRRWKEAPQAGSKLSIAEKKARSTNEAIERYKQRPDYRLA